VLGTLALELVTVLTDIAVNVGTGGQLPAPLTRFQGLAWPTLLVTLLVGAAVTIRESVRGQRRPGLAPSELPPDFQEFAGREVEIAQLTNLLPADGAGSQTARVPVIAIIYGKSGVGKSALAIHFAHMVRARYPDAQLYLDFGVAGSGPLTVGDALSRLIRSLGYEGTLPEDVEELKALYRTSLARTRCVILLDNALSAAQVQSLLPAGPDCLVLITSRGPLVGRGLLAAFRCELKDMSRNESIVLLKKIAGDRAIDAQPSAADRIAMLCGDLPLALSIIAAKIQSGLVGTEEIAARLEDERNRLRELDAPDDHTMNVRSSFELAYQGLPEPERTLWRRLRLVPGRYVTPRVAAALLECEAGAAHDALRRLVVEQVLEAYSDKRQEYGFHNLIGLFADEKLRIDEPAHDRRSALERMLRLDLDDWFDRAGTLEPHLLEMRDRRRPRAGASLDAQLEVLSRFEQERAYLVALLQRADEGGAYAASWQLATCMVPMLELRGYLDEWGTVQTVALRAARALADDTRAKAWAELGMGHLSWLRGNGREAVGHLETVVELARYQGWRWMEARALYLMGRAKHATGRDELVREAMVAYNRAFDIFQEEGLEQEVLAALFQVAVALHELGEIDQALLARMLQPALHALGGRRAQTVWSLRASGRLGELLALVQEALGNLEEAGTYHVGSIGSYRRLSYRLGLARELSNLGRLRLRRENWGQAAEVLEESAQTYQAMGRGREEALALVQLGRALAHGQVAASARDCWRRAHALLVEEGDVRGAAEVQSLIRSAHEGSPAEA